MEQWGRRFRLLFELFILSAVFATTLLGATATAVNVWEGTLPLPTTQEAPPDENPPFDQFSPHRINYPYTLRNRLTAQQRVVSWRAVFLENEYLKCSVLPDLGGHLYTCLDKISGQPMFYANPSIKKALVGMRGAWAAFGVEFNFPVSHNWVSSSPVDFAYSKHPDGSASVIVGNTDRVEGMRWNVELTLRPGSTVLEQQVTLENTSDERQRFYWWTNAAVQAWEDSRIEYPMQFTEGHGLSDIDTWPINSKGVDLSLMSNQKFGPVSRFVHGSREPFMGVYHPRINAGVAHYAEYKDLPAKKIWSWGEDADGLSWRTALSDNNSAYVEVQAGLFRNQETYRFLEPAQTIQFREYWMPVRGTGGISRANPYGVVALLREQQNGKAILRIALNVNRRLEKAQIRILDGSTEVFHASPILEPRDTWTHDLADAAPDRKYTFELSDAQGKPLLTHTEGAYDWTPRNEVTLGPVAKPQRRPEDQWTAADFLSMGEDQEQNGRRLEAWTTYNHGVNRFASDAALRKARGRIAVSLLRYEDTIRDLGQAPIDAESHYYLGLALDPAKAREHMEAARQDAKYTAAANLHLAEISAHEHDYAKAQEFLKATREAAPDDERILEESVVVMRAAKAPNATKSLQDALRRFPNNSLLRLERTRTGHKDETLWTHLGADADRVLDIASVYLRLGLNADAIALLQHSYPAVPPEQTEPGKPAPQDDPRIAYLLAYYDSASTWKVASEKSVKYVFPDRAILLPVLKTAIEKNPQDATAHFLLGSLLFSRGWEKEGIAEWQEARKLNPRLATLHAVLGRALSDAKVYEEGLRYDPENPALYLGLNELMQAEKKPARGRAAMMKRFPNAAAMPEPLVQAIVEAFREDGQDQEADDWIRSHAFARTEGGAAPLSVKTRVAAVTSTKETVTQSSPPTQAQQPTRARNSGVIRSVHAKEDAPPIADPNDPFWKDIPGVTSNHNQYGDALTGGATEFRSRWTNGYLYFLFVCPYESLYVLPVPKINEDTVGLWDRDVAEVFLGSDFNDIKKYKEFEVSPQGEWVDLDIDLTTNKEDAWRWNSGFQVAARIDKDTKVWYGAMKIPYSAIDTRPAKPGLTLRTNLYRIEGPEPNRKYTAWQPTRSPTFHMPVAFGTLELIE